MKNNINKLINDKDNIVNLYEEYKNRLDNINSIIDNLNKVWDDIQYEKTSSKYIQIKELLEKNIEVLPKICDYLDSLISIGNDYLEIASIDLSIYPFSNGDNGEYANGSDLLNKYKNISLSWNDVLKKKIEEEEVFESIYLYDNVINSKIIEMKEFLTSLDGDVYG